MKLALYSVLSVVLLAAAPASAVTFTFNDGGGDGAVIDTSNPLGFYSTSFIMAGSDSGSRSSVVTSFTAFNDAGVALDVSGKFAYLTTDIDGPRFDTFGFVIDGVKTQLSDDAGGFAQKGAFSFLVKPGSEFGWFIKAIDDQFGAAIAGVGADVAPVPLPAALPMLLAAFGGLALVRGRRA